jgi:hypothetical protein
VSGKRASLLGARGFRWLVFGQAVSRLGDGLYAAAIAWLAWTLQHEAAAVAAVVVAANAPAFAATLIGASFADRYDRCRLMIGTDLARGILVGGAAAVVAAGAMNFAGLLITTVVVALAGGPFAPARNALVPQLVARERLLEANGVLQVSFRAAYFAGPLLLAPLLAVTSLPAALALDAITFAISAGTLAPVRATARHLPAVRVRLLGDLREGWATVRACPDVLQVIATFVCGLVLASGFLSVGLIALVNRSLGGGGRYGLLLGISGVCEIVGALVLARLRLGNLALAAVLAWGLVGAFRLPLGLTTTTVEAALLLAVTGFASALTDIPLIALIQARIPERHLAKALGLWEAGIAGAVAAAPFVAAAAISGIGVSGGFLLSGASLLLVSLASALTLRYTAALAALRQGQTA